MFEGFGVCFADGFAGCGGGNGAGAPPLEDLSLTLNGQLARRIESRPGGSAASGTPSHTEGSA